MPGIEDLLERQKKLDARIKAARAKERQKQQRDMNKRIEMIGREVQAYVSARPEDPHSLWVMELLEANLHKPSERALFDFGPLLEATEEDPLPEQNDRPVEQPSMEERFRQMGGQR